MYLSVISREEYAEELGVVARDGSLIRRNIAKLLREPLSRWGLSPRRALLQFVRDQLEAAGLSEVVQTPDVRKILNKMLSLGECQQVYVNYEDYVAPCSPRWIPTGAKTGALLSVGSDPAEISVLEQSNQDDIVTRVSVIDEVDEATLHIAGFRRCLIEEWLRPLNYIRHVVRRLGQPVRGDTMPLEAFWELLCVALSRDGSLLGEDAVARILSGPPGTYFGRHNTLNCEGRWTDDAAEGIWCGYRRGYSDAHWHPIIVAIDGKKRRILDLYNVDEWQWALLARGRASGCHEQLVRNGQQIKLTFPAPLQLETAMDLLGPRAGPWTWTVSDGAPDIWSQVL